MNKEFDSNSNFFWATNMNQEEIEAYKHLAESANMILALPNLHPMEREEICHDFHSLQYRLLARSNMRALGWGQTS